MTEQSKPTERGAAEYKRRHPTHTPQQQDGDTHAGRASGAAAYARRHGNRTGGKD